MLIRAIQLAFVLAAAPFMAMQAQSYTCLPAADSTTATDSDWVVILVTSTDAVSVAKRTAYNLPSTTANKVTVVGSGSTCNAAGAAYHSVVSPGTAPISRTLTVVKVGTTRYVVHDPNQRSGEFSMTVVFDKNWVKLSAWDS